MSEAPPPPASAAAGPLTLPRAPGFLLGAGLLLAVLLSGVAAWRLTPPAVVPADAPTTEFSAARARAYLENLVGPDELPRGVGSEANARGRRALKLLLREIGYEPQEQRTFSCSPRSPSCATVTNVLAELAGSDPQLPALLLVAHYDSVGSGPGASDDGAGVAVLLEVARALKAHPQPTRSVLFLFSDGEEAGLLGAEAFAGVPDPEREGAWLAKPHPWFERVGAVLNLEARGSRGPSLMFETGPESGPLISALAASSGRPVLGSGFATVYRKMPNDTDLSPFRDRGLPGLNFSYIGGVEHYHTSMDDLAHQDPRSLQHHGENVLPTVLSLASASGELRGGELVYFDLLGAFVVRWPASLTPALAGLSLLFLLAVTGLLARGGRGREVLARFAWGFGAFAAALLLGALFAHLGGRWFAPVTPWPAEPGALLTLLPALAGLGVALAAHLCAPAGFWGAWLATWIAWSGIGLGISLTLPGFSYLFVVPALVAGLSALPAAGARDPSASLVALAALAPWAVAVALFAPVLILVYDALGLVAFPLGEGFPRALAPLPLVFALVAPLLLPLLSDRSGSSRGALLVGALGLSLVAGIAAPRARAYAEAGQGDVPRRVNYAFRQDFSNDDAHWFALPYPRKRAYTGEDLPLPPFLRSAPSQFEGPFQLLTNVGYVGFQATARPLPGQQPPLLEGFEVEKHGTGRMIRFRLRSPRGAQYGAMFFPRTSKLKWIKVNGQLHLAAQRWKRFWCYSLPADGLAVELFMEGEQPNESVLILDGSSGLPPSGEVLLELREGRGTPFTDWGDLHLNTIEVTL